MAICGSFCLCEGIPILSSIRLIHLNVAELALAAEPVVMSTLLGSCVSVCIYSPEKRMGGMTHFALPSELYSSGAREVAEGSPRDPMNYGSLALPYLIDELCKLGKVPSSELRAKIVGGAAVIEGLNRVAGIGALNLGIAEEILRKYQIPVVGRDVGGSVGRKVRFFSETGRLLVAPLRESGAQFSETREVEKTEVVTPVFGKKKRVLIVDDSRTFRTFLQKIFEKDPLLEVVGTASDAFEAEALISKLNPDVLTLDLHMPKRDGIGFLERLLPKTPVPVVIITALNLEESGVVLRALELGAIDYIQKPRVDDLGSFEGAICERIRTAASVRVKAHRIVPPVRISSKNLTLSRTTLVVVGASTGGTEAIKELLLSLPKDIPPILIVQHIPAVFSLAFSNRLNELCPFEVKEAMDGDLVIAGRVLIAPGGKQMAIVRGPAGLHVEVNDAPPVNLHKPSVDYLFSSVARVVGRKAVGVILTGMGDDGARGLLEMKNSGARTIAQDEASSIVYGMPRAAVEIGAADQVYALSKIPGVLVKWLSVKKVA